MCVPKHTHTDLKEYLYRLHAKVCERVFMFCICMYMYVFVCIYVYMNIYVLYMCLCMCFCLNLFKEIGTFS